MADLSDKQARGEKRTRGGGGVFEPPNIPGVHMGGGAIAEEKNIGNFASLNNPMYPVYMYIIPIYVFFLLFFFFFFFWGGGVPAHPSHPSWYNHSPMTLRVWVLFFFYITLSHFFLVL